MQNYILILLEAGFESLLEYISAHVLFCLIPAFFIAGAVSGLIPKEAIVRYLGRKTNKIASYTIASIGGLIIAVCSCTILPLFAGIRKRGAGLGPAITFLFVGPAINILAISLTGIMIGWDIAISRLILAIFFGIIIGLIMSAFFKKDEERLENENLNIKSEKLPLRILTFIITLVLILLVGTAKIPAQLKYILISILTFTLIMMAIFLLKREETIAWLKETYFFIKSIIPLLLIGVFLSGIATKIIPKEFVSNIAGKNSLLANFGGVLFGIFVYFPTLIEVPVAQTFLKLGMAKGPLLAYLLADPELSIQSILVTSKIIGKKKVAIYAILVAIACTFAGLIYGFFTTIKFF
jgi:hypothetical protein